MISRDHHLKQTVTSRPLVSRFTILLLAAVLICLDWGRSLPGELTDYFSLVGLSGLALYVSLEFVAYSRAKEHAQSLRSAAEFRLAKHSDPAIGVDTDEWECPGQGVQRTVARRN